MYLKSLELVGFKSFAKRSKLEFKSPVTAVVGPNGSGKSNIAESFRFVLGEQSIKSLRGKKGEDLIWNGGESEPRANRAYAKVVFDNPEGKPAASNGASSSRLFNIDFPEVIIERIVNRDGSNEYLLNGSQVRLKDIVELLSAAHIGSTGHHIISQGEADRVLNSSPKERRAIIEDALGLKIYQYKRLESEKKLEKTRENIAQVESLRREIAPHLKFLKKQMEKYEKAESEKVELVELAKQYFGRESAHLKAEKVRIESGLTPIESKLTELNKELEEAKMVLEKNAKLHKKEYEVLDIEKEITTARGEIAGLERELGKLEGLIAGEERIIKTEEELAAKEEHKMVLLREIEDLFKEISEMSFVEKIRERFLAFINEKKRSSGSPRALEAETRLRAVREDKVKVEKELEKTLAKEKELKEKYESLKKEIDRDKDNSRDAEKTVFRIMSEENDLISKRRALELEREKFVHDEEDYKRELGEVAHLVGGEVLNTGIIEEEKADRKSQEDKKRQIERLKIRLEDAGLAGSAEVAKEYKDTSERDEFLAKELEDLEKSAQGLEDLIKDLGERLASEFSKGLNLVNTEFAKFFSLLFGGGEAKLVLIKEGRKKSEEDLLVEGEGEESEEPGMDIQVSLPRKKIKNLMMLSGGERALTSIALIFAMSQVNPPPFIILDETDAALDEANSKKYGDMIELLAKKSQLILITHNRETMSRAGLIYGVTMGSNGVSKLLSIEFEEAVQVAK